ncbi:polysaccharide biosynthesis/export family protein [Polaribacter sp. Hel_I_88]|uniref:polysaccharide biosynthesis/export family protein n=1 Tax=Polaribacter sp. Hel_I_88 TaxID=1250006 RepID=UPI00047E1581|nr:polysaccharide biosynthesis/export family protein [Polaribacter sp. Hel_I_88]
MNTTFKNFFFISVSIVLLSNCVSKKDIVYFQFDEIDQSKVSNKYLTFFKPDDLLEITISAKDVDAVRPFNLSAVTYSTSSNSAIGVAQKQTYLIDADGEVEIPILGKIKLGGLTRENGIALLKEKLSPDYIINPHINIRIVNFKISVLGDVAMPGNYVIPNERITIIDAIGLAGDLNISGNRENVLVIREENGMKVKYRINLLSNDTFISPVYYLQQNDVVIVEQNYAKIQSASANTNTGLFISLTAVLIGLLNILTR